MEVTESVEPPAETLVFRARGLTKVYDMGEVQVHALRGVDLDLHRSELMVLLGPGLSTPRSHQVGRPGARPYRPRSA